MAALRKLGDKLYLSSNYSRTESPTRPSMDSGYSSIAKDEAFASASFLPDSPHKSPPKLTKAKSMIFVSIFSSISDNIRRSTSLLHTTHDELAGSGSSSPVYETPKKQKSLRNRLSSTLSRATRTPPWDLNRRRAPIPIHERDLSQSPVLRNRDSSLNKSRLSLDVDISNPSPNQTVVEVIFDSEKLEDPSPSPKPIIRPRMLRPSRLVPSDDTNDPCVEQKASLSGDILTLNLLSDSLEATCGCGHVTYWCQLCRKIFTKRALKDNISAGTCTIVDSGDLANEDDWHESPYPNPDCSWVDPRTATATPDPRPKSPSAGDLPTSICPACDARIIRDNEAAQSSSTLPVPSLDEESTRRNGPKQEPVSVDDRRSLPSYRLLAGSEKDSIEILESQTPGMNRSDPAHPQPRPATSQSNSIGDPDRYISDGSKPVIDSVSSPFESIVARKQHSATLPPVALNMGSRASWEASRDERAKKYAEISAYERDSNSSPKRPPEDGPTPETFSLRYADEAIRRKSSLQLEDQDTEAPYVVDGINPNLGLQLLQKAREQAARARLAAIEEIPKHMNQDLPQVNPPALQICGRVIHATKQPTEKNEHFKRSRLCSGDRSETPLERRFSKTKPKTLMLLHQAEEVYDSAELCSQQRHQQTHPSDSPDDSVTKTLSKSPEYDANDANDKVVEFLDVLMSHSLAINSPTKPYYAEIQEQQLRKSVQKSGGALGYWPNRGASGSSKLAASCNMISRVSPHHFGSYPFEPTNRDFVHRNDEPVVENAHRCGTTKQLDYYTCGCHANHVRLPEGDCDSESHVVPIGAGLARAFANERETTICKSLISRVEAEASSGDEIGGWREKLSVLEDEAGMKRGNGFEMGEALNSVSALASGRL